ncbi:hypothetical protein [Hyphomonas sp.]|uniref:hypothetical protein n=1 Tax=Hyphomonas sp. TaxID=87 RepID=UPI003527F782
MSTDGHYLAVFYSDKTGPQWQAWYAMTAEEKRAAAELFADHPHCTIFPCHSVDIMPLLGPAPDA